MKYILALLLIPSLCFGDEWTKPDTVRELSYDVLLAVDWSQTRGFLGIPKPDCQRYDYLCNKDAAEYQPHELNPLVGKRPSQNRLTAFVLGSAIGHYLISEALPTDWRHGWQYVTIGAELGAVAHNYSLGYHAQF